MMRGALTESLNFSKDPVVAWAISDLFERLVDYYSASHLETPDKEAKPRSLWTQADHVRQYKAHQDVLVSLNKLLLLLEASRHDAAT